jgi:hypothetical protein
MDIEAKKNAPSPLEGEGYGGLVSAANLAEVG